MNNLIMPILVMTALGIFTMSRRKRKVNEIGIELIRELEGLNLEAYEDGKGWSIGYGHYLGEEKTLDSITLIQAENFLRRDISWAEDAVWTLVDVPLTSNQFNALVSFVYNIGRTQFAKSTMLKKLNSGDIKGAEKEFKRWNKSGGEVLAGLVKRRELELEVFVS